MNLYGKIFPLIMAGVLILSACAGASATQMQVVETPAASGAMVAQPTHPAMATEPMMAAGSTPEAMASQPTESGTMETQAWFTVPLTDVRSGQMLSLSDFKGKVVLLEDMAVWCITCLSQQMQIVQLQSLLGEQPDLISLSLDIDPNEDAAKLKSYVEAKGFDWHYAVAPVEVSRAIGQLYGAQFLNPPSAPMLIVDRHGNVHPLPFGVKSAADLQQALQPYLNEGM